MDAFARIPKWAAAHPLLTKTIVGTDMPLQNAGAAPPSLPLQTAIPAAVVSEKNSPAQSPAPNLEKSVRDIAPSSPKKRGRPRKIK